MQRSRRDFLKGGCATLGAGAFFARLSALDALAQHHHHVRLAPATDYKALVCVFLNGGNDAWNTIINLDEYNAYAATRSSIALPQASLLPISPPSDGRPFGLHPNLAALHPLFAQQRMAVVCNVGPLVEPLTRDLYQNRPDLRPPNLFSHSDQVYQWHTGASQPSLPTGWAGRMADHTAGLNEGSALPMVVSIAGSSVFGTGNVTRVFETTPFGTVALSGFGGSSSSQARYNGMRQLLTMNREAVFVRVIGDTVTKALNFDQLLTSALNTAPALTTVFPVTTLGDQLKMVARLVSIRNALSVKRQIFFVSLGGFDTHSAQIDAQGGLLTDVAQSLAAFHAATVEMGVDSQVTAFTASDFGRTYRSNGTGTDHGWGSCHFVLGGSVRGGNFYGRWPNLALAGPDDSGSTGRFIPTTSVEEYGATLAAWYGLAAADLPGVFPNVGRFDMPNLGFLV
jgi:uncharacterized protein (DUF1501 family)